MAIPRNKHKPDVFLTVSCIVKWPEITEILLSGQKEEVRTYLLASILKRKLKTIIEQLVKNNIFGKYVV